MLNEEHARLLRGRHMLDRDGNPIGEISEVFVDERTGEPTWVTVKTGWFEGLVATARGPHPRRQTARNGCTACLHRAGTAVDRRGTGVRP